MRQPPNNFIQNLNDSDRWKIQRVYKERHVPALFDLEHVAMDFIFLVLVLALIAILPGMKNKMIKRWIKIFLCLALGSLLISALTQKNWINGSLDIPMIHELDHSNKSVLPASYLTLRISVGLKSLNVSGMVIAHRTNEHKLIILVQDVIWMNRQKPIDEPNWIYNLELNLNDKNPCATDYLNGLKSGWPAVLLDMSEYLANSYFRYYFSSNDISWCSSFSKAGYRVTRLLISSCLVLFLTWFLYLKSLVVEAAAGTFILGSIMIASNLVYVSALAQKGDLKAFSYHINQIDLAYQIDREDRHLWLNLQDGIGIKPLYLWYGWSFWSVLVTGVVCVACSIMLMTAHYFFPHHLQAVFDELTLHDVILTMTYPGALKGTFDPLEDELLDLKNLSLSSLSNSSCSNESSNVSPINYRNTYGSPCSSVFLNDTQNPVNNIVTNNHDSNKVEIRISDEKVSLGKAINFPHYSESKSSFENSSQYINQSKLPAIYLNDVLLLDNALSQNVIQTRQAQPYIQTKRTKKRTKYARKHEIDAKTNSSLRPSNWKTVKHLSPSRSLPPIKNQTICVKSPIQEISNQNSIGSKLIGYFKSQNADHNINNNYIVIPNILPTQSSDTEASEA